MYVEHKTDKTRQDKGWKPPKVGGCTLEACPRNCDLSDVAQDTAEARLLALVSPAWGLGWAQFLEMAQHGPQNAPCQVCRGPKHAICTSFVRGSESDPLGADCKGDFFLGSFRAVLGPPLPIPDPGGPIRAMLSGTVASRLQDVP